ncbi:MAG: hypothetical protein R3F11_17830 [Verrucomicrobiales bacterium]
MHLDVEARLASAVACSACTSPTATKPKSPEGDHDLEQNDAGGGATLEGVFFAHHMGV